MTRVALFALAFSLALPAFADVAPGPPPGPNPGPPPPAPVPGRCDVPSAERPGEQCVECSAWYEQSDKCQRDLGAQGYTQRCRAPGASVWKEVWCRGPASGPPAEKKGCGGCALDGDGDGLRSALFVFALAGLSAVRRRRVTRSSARECR